MLCRKSFRFIILLLIPHLTFSTNVLQANIKPFYSYNKIKPEKKTLPFSLSNIIGCGKLIITAITSLFSEEKEFLISRPEKFSTSKYANFIIGGDSFEVDEVYNSPDKRLTLFHIKEKEMFFYFYCTESTIHGEIIRLTPISLKFQVKQIDKFFPLSKFYSGLTKEDKINVDITEELLIKSNFIGRESFYKRGKTIVPRKMEYVHTLFFFKKVNDMILGLIKDGEETFYIDRFPTCYTYDRKAFRLYVCRDKKKIIMARRSDNHSNILHGSVFSF
ncbi:MAG: hypothetical protein SV062_08615 [Thermodesulfobacteriota bacterium]|nr:hypothetical protein [Thermodesulfobacteriota bacterium]